MTFSIHIDAKTGKALDAAAARTGKSRNAIIREAVAAWLARERSAAWPAEVLAHRGVRGLEPFEKDRKSLRPPPEDPLA